MSPIFVFLKVNYLFNVLMDNGLIFVL